MALKITGQTESSETDSADIVGRFRSGYQDNGEMASLQAFRVTTGDEKVANKIVELLGVDTDHGDTQPQEWEAQGEDYLEVFTKAKGVVVILDSAQDYKSSLVRRAADGEFMYSTDGEVVLAVGEEYESEFTVGDPEPQAGQDLETRKAKAKKGLGSKPDIRVTFSLKDAPELGKFQWRSGGWSLVQNDPEPKLRRLPDGPIEAELRLVYVDGKRFKYTKPELVVRKSLADGVVTNAKPAVKVGDDTPF